MKKINFTVASEISLSFGSSSANLHTDYAFSGFTLDAGNRCFALHWRRLEAPWVAPELFDTLEVRFINVSFLAMKARDPEMPFKEDRCLRFIGYIHADEREEMDNFHFEDAADETFHMIFCFESDARIKIFADEIIVIAT